jgi:undecaprenyl-diphosphatase
MQNQIFDMIFPFATHLGGFIAWIIILVALIAYAKLKNKETLKKVAILALCALLFADLIAIVLKHIVQEPRPFLALDNVRLLIAEDDPFSFPSGHVTSTLAVVTILVLNIEKLVKKHCGIAKIILVLFAVFIAFSRIYCGVHYPFDVLAGAAIGIVSALIVNRFLGKISIAPGS